jgi:hypothetical protein
MNVIAYKGTSKITPVVGTATGAPSGITVNKGSAVNNEIPLTVSVASGSNLGNQDSGQITIPVTVDGKSFTKMLSWSKSKDGAKGDAGDNAIVFTVYAPNGEVFINQTGTLQLKGIGYNGSTEITTGASYQWAKYSGGSWTNVSGGTSSTLTVSGSEVVNVATYKCTMTYGGKNYSDVITLTDKSDSMLASITSTGGNMFKNTVGSSEMFCRLFQNSFEIDELKSSNIGVTAPSSPTSGDFWYKVDKTAKTVTLMKYSGSKWAEATGTDLHKYTYKWYRRDKDNNPLDNGGVFKTGKIIYIDGDDVDVKTTFTCEVE